MIFCNFLLCLIHKVSASHKALCVKHINSVIHIPPPSFFLIFLQVRHTNWFGCYLLDDIDYKRLCNLICCSLIIRFWGEVWGYVFFFCTPPTSADRHLCCLYEHCGHNASYFVRNWYSSVITNVLCWDINTPSRFHLPHLMLLRLDSVAKWFRWWFRSCSSLRYQAPLSHFQRREGGYSVLPDKSTCVL